MEVVTGEKWRLKTWQKHDCGGFFDIILQRSDAEVEVWYYLNPCNGLHANNARPFMGDDIDWTSSVQYETLVRPQCSQISDFYSKHPSKRRVLRDQKNRRQIHRGITEMVNGT